jgi:hypothetical protein
MVIEMIQGLTLQQSLKHPDLVRSFLYGHQVLNLTEGHHPLDAILWASILEGSEISRLLGALSWFFEVRSILVVLVFPSKASSIQSHARSLAT